MELQTTWCVFKITFPKLLYVSNKYALSIRKRLIRSAINKRNKETQNVSKDLHQLETVLSKQLSIDFYILNRSITSQNKIASKITKYTTEKIIFTEKKLQPTYIHI